MKPRKVKTKERELGELTLSGRGLLGFEPIRWRFRGLVVILQQHAEQEGRFLFGVFTAEQWIPARLLTHTTDINQNISPAHRIFYQRTFEQTHREDVHLFDLLNWSKVKDNVADAFFFLADRVNSKTLKLDGSSLQSEETEPSRGISVTRLTFSQPYFRKFFCGLRENLFSLIL